MTWQLVSSGHGKTKTLCPGDMGPAALRSLCMTHVLSGRWTEKTLQEDPSPATHFPGLTTGLQGQALCYQECRLPAMPARWSWEFSSPV